MSPTCLGGAPGIGAGSMSMCMAGSRPHAAWGPLRGHQDFGGREGIFGLGEGVRIVGGVDHVVAHSEPVCPVSSVHVRRVSVSGSELPVVVQSEPMTGVVVYTPTAGPGSGAPHPVCRVTVACVASGAPGAPCQSGIVQPCCQYRVAPPVCVSLSVCVSVGPQVGGGTALPEPESHWQLPTPRPRGQELSLQSVVSSEKKNKK